MASILALILAFVCTFISATGVTQSYSYDRRHLVKQIDQSYQNAALGPVTSVKRTYDGYGAIATEQTYVGGVLKDTWQQVHDSAGRRILLTEANNAATPFTYKYQADGNLVEADFNNAFYNYSYNSDGRLYWRGTPWHVQNITRDLSGRVTAAARTINGISVLDEKITWNGDSTQSGNAITRNGSWNENRSYGYDLRGHLLSENWMPSAAVSGTAIYQFDNNTLGGLGLRTNMTLGGGLSGSNAANYGSFARLSAGEDLNLSRIYYHAQEIAFFGSAPGHPMPCLLAAAIPSSGEDLDLSRIYYHAQQIASFACGRRTHSASHSESPKVPPERAPILHESAADSRQFYFNPAG